MISLLLAGLAVFLFSIKTDICGNVTCSTDRIIYTGSFTAFDGAKVSSEGDTSYSNEQDDNKVSASSSENIHKKKTVNGQVKNNKKNKKKKNINNNKNKNKGKPTKKTGRNPTITRDSIVFRLTSEKGKRKAIIINIKGTDEVEVPDHLYYRGHEYKVIV